VSEKAVGIDTRFIMLAPRNVSPLAHSVHATGLARAHRAWVHVLTTGVGAKTHEIAVCFVLGHGHFERINSVFSLKEVGELI
jgi:hypothetical protein